MFEELREKETEFLKMKQALEEAETFSKTKPAKLAILQELVDLNHKIQALHLVMEIFS